ncbi:MAG: methenyltetrahydromethanopterin cyclohydrolase [Isosphaeraceae bacterium]
MTLNGRALRRVEALLDRAEERKVSSHPIEHGGRYVDCGVQTRGGLAAGLELARICLADLAEVTLTAGEVDGLACPIVEIATDQPVAACLASQYAGWAISEGKYFAMGSGPMRAASGKEAIFDTINLRETPEAIVGVLETRKPPTPAVVAKVASACGVSPSAVTLLVAPTASLAGSVQIVARSVETALHKLHEHRFDLSRICSAFGSAPLPPVARDDLAAIGRTNDAILYGARVVLYVTGDDASLQEIGPKVPSSSSKDHGAPFSEIFARYNHDFYAVDPSLFSPARVVFQNLDTGRTFTFGETSPAVLARSFLGG